MARSSDPSSWRILWLKGKGFLRPLIAAIRSILAMKRPGGSQDALAPPVLDFVVAASSGHARTAPWR